jgi:hypothetical protein
MDPYLDNLQRDRRSLPRPSGVVMFGIYPGRRSHLNEHLFANLYEARKRIDHNTNRPHTKAGLV